ncbi:MAG: PAS domain S-box protein, partial [Proteobacteria bacterium]|nr:PAS domain S-box protein [Pseudomonadota bacterium]
MYLIVATAAVAIISAMLFSMHSGYDISKKYIPLTNAVMEIEVHTSLAHLWLEEYLEGDERETLESVMLHIDKAKWYGNAILYGDENEYYKFIPVSHSQLKKEVNQVINKIEVFREIAVKRSSNHGDLGIGTAIDQEFDDTFRELLGQADQVESTLQNTIKFTMARFFFIQFSLIIATLLLTYTILKTIQNYERQKKTDLQKLQERENYLLAIYRSVTSIAVIPASLEGPDTKIIDFNPGAERMFGYKREDVIGEKVATLHKPVDISQFQQMQDETKEDDRLFKGEFEMIRKNGDVFPAILTLHPRLDPNGHQIGVTNVITDISEQKQYEEQIKEYTEKL